MVQPPSKQLQQILLGKKLCTPRDLKRCVRRVKRLSADLPAFDSVWLDALVQTRRLTSFQAQTIESGLTELLTIGPGIVLDQIGSGPAAATYLVQIPDAQIPAVIKRVPVATELKAATLARFRELAQRATAVGQPGVVVPHACHEVVAEGAARSDAAKTEKGVSPARRRRRPERPNDLMAELAVASRLVEGLPLSQMLLRRGRFPASVVQEIARQLLESLAALDAAGIVHGEILTDNVLIDGKGRAILVDAGVRPCVQSEFAFSATIDPRRYSGIAPELIGTSLPYSPRSDLYALGCLLWELLAARPVYPTGDPLARLAAHQTTRVPDVREIAPDTPAPLAEAILWLTEPDPEQRPRSAADLLGRGAASGRKPTEGAAASAGTAKRSGDSAAESSTSARRNHPVRANRRALTQFSAGFRRRPIGKPNQRNEQVRFAGHVAAACLVVALASAALLAFHGQSRDWVTAAIGVSPRETAVVATGPSGDGSVVALRPDSPPVASQQPAVQELPQPDAYGLITLPDTGPWQAESILWSGQRLTLRGPEQTPAVLYVDRPVRLRASELVIENVEIVFRDPQPVSQPDAQLSAADSPPPAATPARTPAAAVGLESQTLLLQRCVVRSDELASLTGGAAAPASFAFIWQPINPRDSLPGEITLQDARLLGQRCSIGLAGPRHLVRCRNVLQSGPEPLFLIAQKPTPGRHDFQLQHCTLRESGGLLEVRLNDGNAWRSRVHLQPVACVFDLAGNPSQPAGALVRFRADKREDTLTPTWHETLSIDGRDSIARPDLRLVEGVSPDGRYRQELDASNVALNGLIGATFEFQSSAVRTDVAASVLLRHDASLASNVRPGVSDPRQAATADVPSVSSESVFEDVSISGSEVPQ